MRRWTRKAVVWGGAATMAIALGLWRWDVAVVAIGMVMAMFLLVAYSRRSPTIELVRRPSRLRVLEGDRFQMGLRLGARGAWADTVEVYDQLPGYMRLSKGSNHIVMPLYKGEVREASYTVECPLRGAYRMGPLYVRASDALGLFDQELEVPDYHALDVHPIWVELKQSELESRALKYNMGPMTLNEPGRSTDFYSIRDYVKGDPYKKINWKATARLRKLMINEDEKETLSECAIFVDSRAIAASGTPLANFHEVAVRTTLGLARTLVANKNRVMVVTYNDAVNIVPPGISRGHLGIVQAMLVETVARGGLTFDWALGYAGSFLKPRSDVVVLSPLVSDMSFYPSALALIRAGHRVVVVTAAQEEYERLALGGGPSPRAVLLQLQRTTNVAELTSTGIHVIEVAPGEPLLSTMVRLSAALGGERMDLGALEPEEAAPAPPAPEAGAPDRGAALLERLTAEAVGLDMASPRLAVIQVGAIVALLAACQLGFHLKQDMWSALGAQANFEGYIDAGSFLLLTLEAVLFAWLANVLLGSAILLKGQYRRPELSLILFLVLGVLGIWYLVTVISGIGQGGAGWFRFIRFLVMLVPFLGVLSVLRRVVWGSVVAAAILVIMFLSVATPMSSAGTAVLMAVALAVFLELSWGTSRYEGLVRALKGRVDERGRELLGANMARYGLVLAATATASAVGAFVLLRLPGWYVDALGPGMPHPLEATSVFAGVYWIVWLAVALVLGRWAALYIAGTPRGRAWLGRLRRRMVWPSGRSAHGTSVGDLDDMAGTRDQGG